MSEQQQEKVVEQEETSEEQSSMATEPEQKSDANEATESAAEDTKEEEPDDGVSIVLVTGASGFIATHLIKQLLEQGRYRVRGTVRNKKRQEKVKPLLELVPDAKYQLRLVEADLSKPESWAKAVNRCVYVFHVASPFIVGASDEAAIVRTAVEGTTNVLQASADAGTVKRVVVTSSVAAVSGAVGNPPDYIYTEKDWSVEAACSAYSKSKLKAEQAAWDFVRNLDEDKRFELTVVNPSYVQGPLLSASSGEGSKEFCQRLLNNKVPGVPDISIAVVDVRDVAAAHIAAMEKSEAAGNRYILSNCTVHFRQFAQIVGSEFRPQGYKIATRNLPKVVMWVGKFFDSGIREIYSNLGKRVQYSNERMINELKIQPRPVEKSIIDTCYSLVELGLAKKTPGYLGHPSSRPPPPQSESSRDKEATPTNEEDQLHQEKPAETKISETPPSAEGPKNKDKSGETESQSTTEQNLKGKDKPVESDAQATSKEGQKSEGKQGDDLMSKDKPVESDKSEAANEST